MKSVACFVHHLSKTTEALMSLNSHFYVLHNSESQRYKVKAQYGYPGTVHFAVFEEQNLLAITDESHKLVNFYRLNDVVANKVDFPKGAYKTQ